MKWRLSTEAWSERTVSGRLICPAAADGFQLFTGKTPDKSPYFDDSREAVSPLVVPHDSTYVRCLLATDEQVSPRHHPVWVEVNLSDSNVKRFEETMKRSHGLHQRTPIRCWPVLAAAGLIVGVTPMVDPAASTLAIPPEAQAEDEKPTEIDSDQQRIFSGPQPGEKITPFKVLRVKDDQPNELEIVKKTDGTTLICFVHRLSADDRILYGLPLVDFYASKQEKLTSHYVLLSEDRAKMLKMLRGWSRGSLFKASLVSLSVDGAEGPGDYGLNRNVAMTVLVAKGDTVLNNITLEDPNARDLEAIMVAVAKAQGKPMPTLTKVQKELRAERQRQAEKRIKASPVFKIAPNEELGRIMFGMVNGRGNQTLITKRRSQQLLDWAGNDKERQSELKKYCKAVLAGDFKLNQYSQAALQKLAGE